MAAKVIGAVRSGSGHRYEVKWDEKNKELYVSYAGWSHVGTAGSAAEAMRKAEAYLYNK